MYHWFLRNMWNSANCGEMCKNKIWLYNDDGTQKVFNSINECEQQKKKEPECPNDDEH